MRCAVKVAAALLAMGLAAGCAQDAPTALNPSDSALFSKGKSDQAPAGMNQQLAAVRAATAKFQRVEAALEAGYISTEECAALPGVGAMGVHYVRFALTEDAGFDPLQPELLVYEPRKNGKLKLVAVAYLIFRAPWEAAGNTGRPMFGDVPFVQAFGKQAHGLADHHELHVWLWRHNPEGMFAQWNPRVSCPSEAGH